MTYPTQPDPLSIQDRATTAVVAREKLRSAILDGTFPPGTKLIQSDLASTLGVSITPVREALRELASEGLVDLDSYRGAWVHRPTVEEVKEVYAILGVLVRLALREAIMVWTDADVQHSLDLVDLLDDTTDAAEWSLLNRKFHQSLYLPLQWPRLKGMLETLHNTTSYVALTLTQQTRSQKQANAEHREMVAAIRDRDLERLLTLSAAHQKASLEALLSALGD